MYIVTADTIKTDLEATQLNYRPLSIAKAGLSGVSQSGSCSNQRDRNFKL